MPGKSCHKEKVYNHNERNITGIFSGFLFPIGGMKLAAALLKHSGLTKQEPA